MPSVVCVAFSKYQGVRKRNCNSATLGGATVVRTSPARRASRHSFRVHCTGWLLPGRLSLGTVRFFVKSSFARSLFFVMADLSEQHAAVKFCFLFGKKCRTTVEMLNTVYKDGAKGKTQVHEWFSWFKKGELSIHDKPHSGHQSTSRTDENVEKVRARVLEDQRQTIEELEKLSGIPWSSVRQILAEDLGMKMVTAKFVPRILTDAMMAISHQNRQV